MTGQELSMLSPFAAWIVMRPLPISASAKPCWRESDHHRFAWEDDECMTGLTSIAGWTTIRREGGP